VGVSERIIGISIISYGKNSLDLRPTSVTTSPRERIELVSQGPTVMGAVGNVQLISAFMSATPSVGVLSSSLCLWSQAM
jgi:hypothetical protein